MTAFERLTIALAGRYRLEREVGRGGMATVYLARDLKHDRRVAIKVLRDELAARLGADRFLREITTTAALRHPHILPLYDSGDAGGALFYVMPFVEGESLQARLARERQLPLPDAVGIAREVADALGYAHGEGVIHRDIKPANILLERGHAVVADFGIARAVNAAGSTSLTAVGMAVGTPSYMSPEQAAAEPHLDGRTDVYALGCVLYEMLAGHPPFPGGSAREVIVRHAVDPVPPVSAAREAVPPHIELVLARALAKAPADRFDTATEFGEALVTPSLETVAGHADRVGRLRSLRSLVLVALGAVFAVVSWWAFRWRAASAGSSARSVAVLYFDNQSPDSSDAYLADGLTDEIALRLSRIPRLAVKSRYAVRRFRGTTVTDPVALGRALGVTMLIDGGVQRAAHRLRVTVELVDAATGNRDWDDEYDRSDTDVLQLESQVAQSIATAVAGRLAPTEREALVQAPTASGPAYDHFLRGNALLARRTPAATAAAIREYRESLRIDSGFTRTRARIAFGYALFLAWGWPFPGLSSDSILARGVREDSAALVRDSTSSDAWMAAGILRWIQSPATWTGALEAHERAVALDPTNAEAQNLLGVTEMSLGRDSAAARALRRALALDPYRPITLQRLAEVEWYEQDRSQALHMLDSALTLDPAFSSALADRAAARLEMNDLADARVDLETWARVGSGGAPAPRRAALLAAIDARTGDTADATAVVDSLLRRFGHARALFPRAAAAVALGLFSTGARERALEVLERAAPRGPALWSILRRPEFDPVRSDSRFQRVMAASRPPSTGP